MKPGDKSKFTGGRVKIGDEVTTWLTMSEPRERDDLPFDDLTDPRAARRSHSLRKRLSHADHVRLAGLLSGAIANLEAAAAIVQPVYGATDKASRPFGRASAIRRGLANLTASLDDHWRAERHAGDSPYEKVNL